MPMTASVVRASDQVPLPCTVTDSYEYDAYGNHWTAEGSTPNNMFYRGEEYDSDLSLVYLRARYMNPLTGRFMSRDPKEYTPLDTKNGPLDPSNLNTYLYASSNPVNRVDPSGRDDLVEGGELESNNEAKAEPVVKETGRAAECLYLLQADLLWCSIYAVKGEFTYWACTQRAHLNYYRCLAGLDAR